jgi:hypothetical protein
MVTRLDFLSLAKTFARRQVARRAVVSMGALLVILSASPALAQGSGDPLGDMRHATPHIGYLEMMLMHLHWRWIEANQRAVAADRGSAAALEAANKCASSAAAAKQARSLIDTAGAKLAAAEFATSKSAAIEKAILDDVDTTMKALANRDPNAAHNASFAELREAQDSFPWVAMIARTGLDPSDDPMTGHGLLSAARSNLKQARDALARCTGHAAAPGSELERFASRSVR